MTTEAIDDAMSAEYKPRPRIYFGTLEVDTWYCVLQKGVGKVLFDPNLHRQDDRRVAITLTIVPLPGSRFEEPTKRELIAESEEWAKIVKPSINALHSDLRRLNGAYVQAELVPTGRRYKTKEGLDRDATTFRFQAVFPDHESAVEAANKHFGTGPHDDEDSIPAPAPRPMPDTNAERATAQKFLPALWKASGGDPNRLAELIAKNPLTSKYFTLASDEVVAIIAAA